MNREYGFRKKEIPKEIDNLGVYLDVLKVIEDLGHTYSSLIKDNDTSTLEISIVFRKAYSGVDPKTLIRKAVEIYHKLEKSNDKIVSGLEWRLIELGSSIATIDSDRVIFKYED